MAKEEIELTKYQAIKENLERRFSSLMNQRGMVLKGRLHPNFFIAETGYIRYIGENELISYLVREAVSEGRIEKKALREIFNTFILAIGPHDFNLDKITFPLFWDDDLEKEYELRKEFIEMVNYCKKTPSNNTDAKEPRIWLEEKRDDEYLLTIIQKLHNDLLEKIDGKVLIIKTGDAGYAPGNQANDGSLKEIKNIIVVTKTQQASPLIVINKKYDEAIAIVDSTSKNIKALVGAIEDDTDVLRSDDLVQCRDYLNSNANCKLYRNKDGEKQIYKLTEIVRFDDPYKHDRKLEISKKVATRKMTNQDYKRNLSKQKNRIGT